MTPQEKLKEIESVHVGDSRYITQKEISWLISRVKQLEEALEFCSVINFPSKPVKGEDFAQHALEEHCAMARKALRGEDE